MSKNVAANLSLAFALLMWPLSIFGVLNTFADLALDTPPTEVNTIKAIYGGLPITIATLLLISSAWLSGYSFSEAKRRAILSALLCAAFSALAFWGLVLGPITAL